MPWYSWDQNNSGGSFVVDSELCHRLFIEADSYDEAEEKALSMGVYYNGCDEGRDCSCCGDRWHEGEEESIPETFTFSKDPKVFKTEKKERTLGRHKMTTYIFKISSIEDYAKALAFQYGWTTPDVRLFYKDGTVKEIDPHEKAWS